MSVTTSTGTFRVFKRFADVADAMATPEVQDLYGLLGRLREAARTRRPSWASYPTLVHYADVCFWAIRKLEYAFAVEAFVRGEHGRRLDVLDVGCGVVPLCNWMSQRGHQVTAVDPSAADIGFLVRNDLNRFYGSHVDYAVARAERLPWPDQSFDVVTCISVLEHLPPGNDRVALSEMTRVLRPGGTLILTFDVSPPRPWREGDGPLPSDWRRYNTPFSPAATSRLLDESLHQCPPGLISELQQLSWDDVASFWRASRLHDQNREDVRDYLACGLVLEPRAEAAALRGEQVVDALLEGQAAIIERVEFHQAHAEARLELLRRAEASHGLRRRLLRPLASPGQREYAPRPLRVAPHYARTRPPRPAPRITLVTPGPNLNQAHFLEQARLSVQQQAYPCLEHILQDGEPSDSPARVLNLAFGGSVGEIMSWLAADDLLLPGALAAVAACFHDQPGVDVVYGQQVIIDAAGQEVGREIVPPGAERYLAWTDCLPRDGVFWRRSIWDRAGGGMDEGFSLAASRWELLLRYQRLGARFARLPRFLVAARTHPLATHSAVSQAETDLLHQRYLGRSPTPAEVARATRPLVLRQTLFNQLDARGLLRY
jgi:SAM-dependent methyltransferase